MDIKNVGDLKKFIANLPDNMSIENGVNNYFPMVYVNDYSDLEVNQRPEPTLIIDFD